MREYKVTVQAETHPVGPFRIYAGTWRQAARLGLEAWRAGPGKGTRPRTILVKLEDMGRVPLTAREAAHANTLEREHWAAVRRTARGR